MEKLPGLANGSPNVYKSYGVNGLAHASRPSLSTGPASGILRLIRLSLMNPVSARDINNEGCILIVISSFSEFA